MIIHSQIFDEKEEFNFSYYYQNNNYYFHQIIIIIYIFYSYSN